MKRILLLTITLLLLHSANALVVSVKGEGEIPEEGMELTVTDAEQDILTGKQVMALDGDLLTTAAQLTVRIYRSATDLTDEFCCGNNCTAGNGQQEETKTFDLSGLTHWYAHYTPTGNSDETIRYFFDDGTETRELQVRYIYTAEAVENVKADATNPCTKQLRDGNVYIIKDGNTYSVTGMQ